jgi:tRNA (guanine37-N1)-methyltransferase
MQFSSSYKKGKHSAFKCFQLSLHSIVDEYVLKKHLREILAQTLSLGELANVYNSYDIIGDIAIIRLTEASEPYGHSIADAIMKVHKNVKTVLAQTGPVRGGFRVRKLKCVAGEERTITTHMESGCAFSVDLRECYFSPRLSHERMRIAEHVKNGEVVVNMFAGVGCFSILIAKHSNASKVYSIDVNPTAIQYMQANIKLNRAYGKVIPIFGDAKEAIKKGLRKTADRVLMPLPEKALEYLPDACSALKESGGWIHYYDFEHAKKNEDPVRKTKSKVVEGLENMHATFEVPFGRVVRHTGPNWYQIVLDISITG